MLIVWVAVIVLSIIVEAFTYEMVALWFIPAAIPPLIMSIVDVGMWWQIGTFVVLSFLCIISLRPILKRYLIKETVHTNITDSNFGKKVRLTSEVVDGNTLIELNGVTWKARVVEGEGLEKDSFVEIVGSESNEFLVKAINKS